MSTIATAHVAFGFASLALGGVTVVRRKGTTSHRLTGHAYYLAMLGLNATAFQIYDLFGSFGVFHWAAVVSLATLMVAMVIVLLRRPRRTWKFHHGYFMLYSYVGLLCATAAEIAVRVPPLFHTDSISLYVAVTAGGASMLVFLVGSAAVRRTMERIRLESPPMTVRADGDSSRRHSLPSSASTG